MYTYACNAPRHNDMGGDLRGPARIQNTNTFASINNLNGTYASLNNLNCTYQTAWPANLRESDLACSYPNFVQPVLLFM